MQHRRYARSLALLRTRPTTTTDGTSYKSLWRIHRKGVRALVLCWLLRNFGNMGKKFGNLAKINGIVYFRLSPYEQKAFKGIISEGVPNLIRRIQGSIFRVTPPFMLSYLIMNWAKEKNDALSRKNPKDYENDT
ncbi:cytochrome b-c1 complex subunit 8 [Monomorium pharaonis]|uniref:cytochrome b-c1 complex subunit 8 n=1 Tax=Monomorium pharaonis TaxID=307658 RepID=UPI0017463AC6|nr:cytochrome b-c1 complex subunit 8 [Monomorium pharaonis]